MNRNINLWKLYAKENYIAEDNRENLEIIIENISQLGENAIKNIDWI